MDLPGAFLHIRDWKYGKISFRSAWMLHPLTLSNTACFDFTERLKWDSGWKLPPEHYHDFFGTVSWLVTTQSEHSIKIIKAFNYVSVKHPTLKGFLLTLRLCKKFSLFFLRIWVDHREAKWIRTVWYFAFHMFCLFIFLDLITFFLAYVTILEGQEAQSALIWAPFCLYFRNCCITMDTKEMKAVIRSQLQIK